MSLTKLLPSFWWMPEIFSQAKPVQPTTGKDTALVLHISRPRFDELPLKQSDPKGSAWGLWGDQDERGTLNLITDDVVRAASAEAVLGNCLLYTSPSPRD